ncbi:MAG: type II secretion system minor pseudopilin GspI [Proteobacteria bacterium]|nr:type II secretion system minor pseudopilin GspI [Pseudomonadota bacterium]
MKRNPETGKRGLQTGFTLIEVLVALVIVAVGMGVLMSTLTSSAKNVVYLQDRTFAEWVALNQITLLRLQLQKGQLPPQTSTNGDIDFAGRSWHWRQDVKASEVPGIDRIDFKVRPKEVKGGDDDSWYVTVTGLAGNSLAAPGSAAAMVQWDPDLTGPGGLPGGPGNNPGILPNNPNPTPNPSPNLTPTPTPTPPQGGNQ